MDEEDWKLDRCVHCGKPSKDCDYEGPDPSEQPDPEESE